MGFPVFSITAMSGSPVSPVLAYWGEMSAIPCDHGDGWSVSSVVGLDLPIRVHPRRSAV